MHYLYLKLNTVQNKALRSLDSSGMQTFHQ